MKSITRMMLLLTLALTTLGAQAATLEEILAAMPAQTTEDQAARMAELVSLGPIAIGALCDQLVPAGGGDDLAVRYALSGVVKHCTRPGAMAEREKVAGAIAKALPTIASGEVRAFLLQQLQFCGTTEEADTIAAQLDDPETAAPAQAALAAIGAARGPVAIAAADSSGDEAGFEPIFNGKNLAGWRGHRRGYDVEDGVLIWQEGGKNIYTRRQYDNFILRFAFKLTPGANNGVGLRVPRNGHAAYDGMEIQVLDNTADKYKDLKDYQYHGSVYGVAPAKRGFLKPVGEWNEQEIIADGPNIKVTLNGTVIVDVNLEEASANGTLDEKDHPGLLNKRGHIMLLGHGSVVSFRDLRVKEL